MNYTADSGCIGAFQLYRLYRCDTTDTSETSETGETDETGDTGETSETGETGETGNQIKKVLLIFFLFSLSTYINNIFLYNLSYFAQFTFQLFVIIDFQIIELIFYSISLFKFVNCNKFEKNSFF